MKAAQDELASPAGVAGKAVSTVPADAHALPRFPLRDVSSNRVDQSGNFVARNAWVLQPGKARLFYDGVTVADAAGLYLNSHLGSARFWYRALDDFKVSTRFADLCGFHSCDPFWKSGNMK